jgi:hypothetical protein
MEDMSANEVDRAAAVERLNADFRKHSEAAAELYSGIYAIVESTCGIGLPVGCSPLQAVKMLADRAAELTRERDAIEGVAVELRRFQWYGYREDDEAFRSSKEDVRKAAGLNVPPAGDKGGAP